MSRWVADFGGLRHCKLQWVRTLDLRSSMTIGRGGYGFARQSLGWLGRKYLGVSPRPQREEAPEGSGFPRVPRGA